jgi:hypothetical protein
MPTSASYAVSYITATFSREQQICVTKYRNKTTNPIDLLQIELIVVIDADIADKQLRVGLLRPKHNAPQLQTKREDG